MCSARPLQYCVGLELRCDAVGGRLVLMILSLRPWRLLLQAALTAIALQTPWGRRHGVEHPAALWAGAPPLLARIANDMAKTGNRSHHWLLAITSACGDHSIGVCAQVRLGSGVSSAGQPLIGWPDGRAMRTLYVRPCCS